MELFHASDVKSIYLIACHAEHVLEELKVTRHQGLMYHVTAVFAMEALILANQIVTVNTWKRVVLFASLMIQYGIVRIVRRVRVQTIVLKRMAKWKPRQTQVVNQFHC